MRLSILVESKEPQMHPGIWNANGSLQPEIRENLLQVAKDFQKQHYLPDESIVDITLTGSIANYNWTEYSDIDLHILADFDKIEDNLELLTDYYKVAKSLWNNGHDIEICGHEVEIYVQNSEEPHHSSGIYSILNDEWLQKPIKENENKPDESLVRQKAEGIITRINSIEKLIDSNPEAALERGIKLKDKIKKMRKAGLTRSGEYSIENLAFKFMRDEGHLDRLIGSLKAAYDSQFCVDNCSTDPMEATMTRETITENSGYDETLILPNNQKQGDEKIAKAGSNSKKITTKDLLDAHKYLEDLRKQKYEELPLDQKLSAILQKAETSLDISRLAMQRSESLSHTVKNGFDKIHNMLEKLAAGKPMDEPIDEPIEPGTHALDDAGW